MGLSNYSTGFVTVVTDYDEDSTYLGNFVTGC